MLFFLLPQSVGAPHIPLVKIKLALLSVLASDCPIASEGKSRGREHRPSQTQLGTQMADYVWASSVSFALIPNCQKDTMEKKEKNTFHCGIHSLSQFF